QARVLNELVALGEGEVSCIGEDRLLAPLGVEDNLRPFELRRIILEAAHLERLRRHEAMAARLVAGLDAIDGKRDGLRLLRLRAEGGDNGMQRPHPSK